MTIRTPITITITTAAVALALAAPLAASAAHGHRGKSVEVKSSTRGNLDTPTSSYIYEPATPSSPATYITVDACQRTGGCVGVPDPDTAGS